VTKIYKSFVSWFTVYSHQIIEFLMRPVSDKWLVSFPLGNAPP